MKKQCENDCIFWIVFLGSDINFVLHSKQMNQPNINNDGIKSLWSSRFSKSVGKIPVGKVKIISWVQFRGAFRNQARLRWRVGVVKSNRKLWKSNFILKGGWLSSAQKVYDGYGTEYASTKSWVLHSMEQTCGSSTAIYTKAVWNMNSIELVIAQIAHLTSIRFTHWLFAYGTRHHDSCVFISWIRFSWNGFVTVWAWQITHFLSY